MHQSKPCDVVTGDCHCLANYTGWNCELPRNTSEMMPNPPGIIVGALVGSTTAVLIVIAVAVLVLLIIFSKNFLSCHQTRQANLKISPSSQFEISEAQSWDIKLEHSLSLPPSNNLIQQSIPKIIVTKETPSCVEN